MLSKEMKKLLEIAFILTIFCLPAIAHDEEIYTSGGQWPVSSSDDDFIHYRDQSQLTNKNKDDEIEGRFFVDQEDVTDDYQVHAIYILASDSKDKKYDTNGTIENIVIKGNAHLKENTNQQQFRLDLRENGKLDVSFIRVNKTRKEINKIENGAGYFTGMAILHGFNNPKKLYTIFYQDKYKREWGQVGDALFNTPNGEVEVNAGVVYLGKEKASEAWVPHIHELFHAIGFVQLCAPGAVTERNSRWGKNDHLNYKNDIMSDRGGDRKYIDKKRNEYYGHSNINCELNLEKSAFMEPTKIDIQLQPFSPSCKLTRWQPVYNHKRSLDCLEKLDF
tara:strand:- start:269 stop:1270 length:1002 start_codon:yes stop_codon:yes gene_type:complete